MLVDVYTVTNLSKQYAEPAVLEKLEIARKFKGRGEDGMIIYFGECELFSLNRLVSLK